MNEIDICGIKFTMKSERKNVGEITIGSNLNDTAVNSFNVLVLGEYERTGQDWWTEKEWELFKIFMSDETER